MADTQMTQVRIKLLINAEGKYAAYGYTDANKNDYDEVLYNMMESEDQGTLREFYVLASVPTPQRVEVIGVVEAADVKDASDA